MTDSGSIHGSTSSSSDVPSSRGGILTTRIRVIRMARPNPRRLVIGPEYNASFGFAVRGGREFGTGFFVSKVEKGSEAELKGLRAGDQIIRANGYHVDDAVHKEFAQFVSSQERLTLKVRGIGMLPIREKTIDPLTWHIVPHRTLTALSGLDELTPKDVRIVLNVAPRTKLGLGICKGPEWKPGIFVQFTKEFSIAKDAGLRPGDQILSCNSIDFSDVLFSEAVAVMKSAQTLEMIVRIGAGLDLFPGESSGYNSSASSITGDQSPCWGDQASKRLSIVREESYSDRHDRLNLDRRKDHHRLITSDRIDCARKNERNGRQNINENNNKTIIQLSENGTLINNTIIANTNTSVHLNNGLDNVTIKQNSNVSSSSLGGDGGGGTSRSNNLKLNFQTITQTDNHPQYRSPSSNSSTDMNTNNNIKNGKIADICFVSRQSETKTVIVEVHRAAGTAAGISPEENDQQRSSVPAVPPPPKPPTSVGDHDRSPSAASSISSYGNTSLSSAISDELKKRRERMAASNDTNHLQSLRQPQRFGNPSLGGKDNDDSRHSALMDEFKRAHRKMFKNGLKEDETSGNDSNKERKHELSKTIVMRDEVDHAPSINGHQATYSDNNQHQPDVKKFPTPPPPPQFANESAINSVKYQNGFNRTATVAPPQTPSPDYDSTPSNTLPKNNRSQNPTSGYSNGSVKGTMGRVAASEMAKANGDVAELESIESFQMQNPSSPIPRPPSLYFAPQSSGPATMKKSNRPISVTISEYGGQMNRKEPSRLEFIHRIDDIGMQQQNQLNASSPVQSSPQHLNEGNVSDNLRSELERTLSRSNLKKRNDFNGATDTKKIINNKSNGFNGKQTQGSFPSNGKPVLHKTQSSNIEMLTNMLRNKNSISDNLNNNSSTYNNGSFSGIGNSNRVTINMSNKQELRKTESGPTSPTNGILKNSFTKNNLNGDNKNITFSK